MEAEFRHILGRNCDILTLGALDHLDKNEITRHPPVSGDDTLYTTLPPDNSPVLISKRLVIDGLRRRMRDLSPDAILYDCMGYSHRLQTKVETICSTVGIIAIGATAHLAERLLGIQDK